MPDALANIAYIGATVGVITCGVALFNARKALLWKRAELASSYLKEFTSNQELVFACRALDWRGGKLVVPDGLRALLVDKKEYIEHDILVLERAMAQTLSYLEIKEKPELQLYRTAMDDFLSWLGLISGALDRDLFSPEDVRLIGYYIWRIYKLEFLNDFIKAYGYERSINKLTSAFELYFDSYNHADLPLLERPSAGFGGDFSKIAC